jgi:hypothetical protein
MHPLATNLSSLKDTELENKIQELSRRYFQTANAALQHQLIVLLEDHKEELRNRRQKEWREQYQNRNTDLDNLINVS